MTRVSRERRRNARTNRGPGRPRRLTWRGLAVSMAVAALFLAFASFISFMAPVTVLILQREGGRAVRADVTHQLWLFIPVRTRTLRDVDSVTTRTHREPGYTPPTRTDGPGPGVLQPEEEGFIVLSGERGSVEIGASPRDIDEIRRRVSEFLAGSDVRLRLWIASNWKVAVLVEAVIALPGVLILLAVAWDIGKVARRLI
jgi:hypothetical protein